MVLSKAHGATSLLALALLLLTASISHAAVKGIDDFDQYVDDPDLRASWVVSHAKDTVFVKTPGYQASAQSIRISYHNGAEPYWTAATMTYATVQDWSAFSRVACRFVGMYPDDPVDMNLGEKFRLRIYDDWGGYIDGDPVSNATMTYDWVYYSMDISSWANRGNVRAVAIIVEPEDYGAGVFHVDRLHLDTQPPVVDDYETYLDSSELRNSWLYGANNLDFLLLGPGPDGVACEGNQYCGLDYLCSQPPYQADLTLEFDSEEDWSGYETLTMCYRGRPDPFNSSEALRVTLEDSFGGYLQGPVVSGATWCSDMYFPYCDWYEYSLDISTWGSKGFVKKVTISIVPESYGAGRFYIDEIKLSGPGVSTRPISWGEIKARYKD